MVKALSVYQQPYVGGITRGDCYGLWYVCVTLQADSNSRSVYSGSDYLLCASCRGQWEVQDSRLSVFPVTNQVRGSEHEGKVLQRCVRPENRGLALCVLLMAFMSGRPLSDKRITSSVIPQAEGVLFDWLDCLGDLDLKTQTLFQTHGVS